MIDPILQLFSQTHWIANGSDTEWNFAFENGYISRDYVKAYTLTPDAIRADIVVTDDMFTGEFQLTISPAVPDGYTLVIYRDTPKNAPIVNYTDGANQSEVNLDTTARQAVHLAAEILDGTGVSLSTNDLGFKSLKRNAYTGTSTVLAADNGKAHYKTDATAVTVPNSLDIEFLTTIINNSASPMSIAFVSATAYPQGTEDPASALWTLSPYNSLTITKVANGVWFIAGLVADAS